MSERYNSLSDTEKQVLNLIPLGRDNAIQIKEIKQKTGYAERTIKQVISQLVKNQGLVITSNRNPKRGKTGYFIPVSEQERIFGYQSFQAQLTREMDRLKILKYSSLSETIKVKKEVGEKG